MSNTKTVHWLGAGLSSTPGIQAIAKTGISLIVWNRTLSKAQESIQGLNLKNAIAREYSLKQLESFLNAGDIVVSMLPATMHPEVATICLKANAHLVTTSYISDTMRSFHKSATEKGLSFINEAGLDPGIDHLLAHELQHLYTSSLAYSPDNTVSLKSLCGGFPENSGEFCYKFSWSPLGVLRALTNKSRFISEGKTKETETPWKELFQFGFEKEIFEAYPNRDSLSYLQEYGFQDVAKVSEFIRGTIRPKGWSHAWKNIFETVEKNDSRALEVLSEDLWHKYQYTSKERDRVLLFVELSAFNKDQKVWSKSLVLNEFGSGKFTAMARTVSLPATFAVESILNQSAKTGVSGPPKEREEYLKWFKRLEKNDIRIIGL